MISSCYFSPDTTNPQSLFKNWWKRIKLKLRLKGDRKQINNTFRSGGWEKFQTFLFIFLLILRLLSAIKISKFDVHLGKLFLSQCVTDQPRDTCIFFEVLFYFNQNQIWVTIWLLELSKKSNKRGLKSKIYGDLLRNEKVFQSKLLLRIQWRNNHWE